MQLGSEMQQQSALQGGIQEMSAPAPTSLAGLVKDFGILDFPFIVSNFSQADALIDGPVGKMLLAKLPEKGLVGLTFWDLGFPQRYEQQAPDYQSRGPCGLETSRDPEPGFPGDVSDLQGESGPDAFL